MTGGLDRDQDGLSPDDSRKPLPPMPQPPPQWDFAPLGTVDKATGRPLSDKSKATAGLLQVLPGVVLIGGIGRIYAGQVFLGVVQLMCSVIGWGVLCVSVIFVGLVVVPLVLWLWFVLDGLMILLGHLAG